MSFQQNPACGTMSVTGHYGNVCCQWCTNRKLWSNRRKRGRNSKRKTLRTHRTGVKR